MFCGFVGLMLVHSFGSMVVSMCFVGLGLGMASPGFSAAASMAVEPHEQGAVAGLIAACPALGFIIGPLLGATLYQWQPLAPYALSAGLFLPLILFAWSRQEATAKGV
jgi:MFS family permease